MGSIVQPESVQASSLSWRLLTLGSSAGAVAIFAFTGDITLLLRTLELPYLLPGSLRVSSICGIDHGVVAFIHPGLLYIMPHGGIAIVRALEQAFTSRGLSHEPVQDPSSSSRGSSDSFLASQLPLARSRVEAMALKTLAFAASPIAIDLLLAQHDRWLANQSTLSPREEPTLNPRDTILSRLITPPLVVAFGPANVGKSTLINALARRQVSIVADMPGTTRDHVGACIEVDGLVVRYLDTPGMRATADPIEARSQEVAMAAMQKADLVLHIGDAASPPPPLPPSLASIPRLCVHLRADRKLGTFDHDIALRDLHVLQHTSTHEQRVHTETQLSLLASLIRESLVPKAMYDSPEPWLFWESVDSPASTDF